ncbi:MAG: ORF6N domain-containing protein [Arcobacteraceae bacterium]|nr:ORF6N domain-containing protein [Arcobacteraceae bacterium]
MDKLQILNHTNLQHKIHTIREFQVMIDHDLAELYGVEIKALNQAVKRNEARFPSDFMFQLSKDEFENIKSQFITSDLEDSLRSQNVTLENGRGKHRKYLPYAFTEQGVSMLSAILKSNIAVEISIQIIRAFVEMRKIISSNSLLFSKMEALEKRQITFEIKTDTKIELVLNALEDKNQKPDEGIFYDGQIYDAYIFVNDLLKNAKNEVLLIDNYIDDSVFTLFSKYQNVKFTIYTSTITKQLNLDYQKYKSQYKNIELFEFKKAHDRFFIIDKTDIYHLGASLKDLGKRWFAFSKFESRALEILEKLK